MKAVLSQLLVFPLADEVERLAKEYVRYGAVPEINTEDAYHIARKIIAREAELEGLDFIQYIKSLGRGMYRRKS